MASTVFLWRHCIGWKLILLYSAFKAFYTSLPWQQFSLSTVDLQVAIFASFSNEQKIGIFWVKNGGFLRMVKVDIFVFDQP